MFEVLKVLTTFVFYLVDVVMDVRVIKKLCCHNAGQVWSWATIVNPHYCATSFTLTLASSIVCNGITCKQFIYCIIKLCCLPSSAKTLELINGTITIKMFEALFEGVGQMCLQMYMVMEKEQFKLTPSVGNLSFSECTVAVAPTNSTSLLKQGLQVMAPNLAPELVGNTFYISITASLFSVCFTIIKGAKIKMEKGYLWIIGYTLITVLAVGSRVYLQSTLGTYWKTSQWFWINIFWLTPIIACNIASMIYACTVPRDNFSFRRYLKRSVAGTCDFLSKDGLPTSVSYFICAVVFNVMYWPNIHLQIGIALATIVLLVNIVFAAFFVKKPIFLYFFEDDEIREENNDVHVEMQVVENKGFE